jgi:4'-phosphopantetheinyl transferase
MVHVWQARLDARGWPAPERLPAAERERAARILAPSARDRWVAARWALRGVLGRELGEEPGAVALRAGPHGKPELARCALHFNLSHSGELALVAISPESEVGVDVQRIGKRPAGFYADWTRREATVKCHGTGLWAPAPDAPVAVADLDAGPGYAAAVAVAGETMPPLRRFTIEPTDLAAG